MDNRKLLKDSLEEMNIKAMKDQMEKLMAFQDLIFENNKKINLVGTMEREDILRRHILDSVSLLTYADRLFEGKEDIKILDIGTGGGFPGIPLAIFLKDSKMVLLEKSGKKVDFLNKTIRELSLNNILVLPGRAEELASQKRWRGHFDIVIARAVTKFSILLELSVPFCNINGRIIFYKSRKVFEEIETRGDAIEILGGKIEELIKVKVSGLEEFRAFLIMKKERQTPSKYPRNFAHIKREPLEGKRY
ncbi:MAG: 16S rRNA (guanine(527)-N(7))-methyltransferase RsmG [Actinomycetia bacterium]|nr:16S rRNA (guanine(527)-N(7))-methyltransferase RsmG [Actinomycetes bacterium]